MHKTLGHFKFSYFKACKYVCDRKRCFNTVIWYELNVFRMTCEAILPASVEVSGSPVDVMFHETAALANGHPVIATAKGSTVNIDEDLNTVAKEVAYNPLIIVYCISINLYLS